MNNKAKGFTLVELMISLALGLLIIGGVLYVFLSSSQTFRMNEAQSRVQENGRFALELLAREIRHAGFNPTVEFCGGSGPKNEDYSESALEILPDQMRILTGWSRPDNATTINEVMTPFRGNSGSSGVKKITISDLGTDAKALKPIVGSDVLEIQKQNNIRSLRWHPITAHNTGENNFEIEDVQLLLDQLTEINADIDKKIIANADLKNVLVALDRDCTRGTVFSGEVTNGTISYTTNNDPKKSIGLNYAGGRLVIAAELSESSKASFVRYFIAQPDDADVPSLYRQYNNNAPEALIEGVSAFAIDRFTGSASPSNTGVTVKLDIMSRIGGFTESEQADGRLQQRFETTVAVRNRI